MKALGYTFSTGRVLCARHATSTHDPYVQSGEAIPIYRDSLTYEDLSCDVAGCGIILAKNGADGCGEAGYEHFLYYGDPEQVSHVLAHIQETLDPSAQWQAPTGNDYMYVVTFTTDAEFSEGAAHALIERLEPDGYDLNVEDEQ
jgi:hypothetical protein